MFDSEKQNREQRLKNVKDEEDGFLVARREEHDDRRIKKNLGAGGKYRAD